MNLRLHHLAALLLVSGLAAFTPVSAQSFDWFQPLESNESEGYRDVWGLGRHGDAVYVAARIELVKYDTEGNELWRRAPDTGFERQELCGVVANDLGSYAVGRAQTPAGRSVGILQMFDSGGAVRGTVSFEDEIDEIWELALTDDALVDLDLNGDSYSEIAVLAARDETGLDGTRTVGVQVRQALTGWQVAWVGFPDAYGYRAMRDVARIEDMNGDGRPELAVLCGEDSISGSAEFTIKDLLTKRVLGQGTHSYPDSPEPPRRPIAIAGLAYSGPAVPPGVGMLFDKPNGQGILEVYDAVTGGWTDDVFFVGAGWSVLDVASPPSHSAVRSQVGVLVVDHETGVPGVQIKEVETGTQVRWLGLPVE